MSTQRQGLADLVASLLDHHQANFRRPTVTRGEGSHRQRRHMSAERFFGRGIASGDVRRASVSKPSQSFDEMWQRLRHTFGSMTATIIYRMRDRGEAIEQSVGLSNVQESDIPVFPPPSPRRRRSAAQADRRR